MSPSPPVPVLDLLRAWHAARREERWEDAAELRTQLDQLTRRPPPGKIWKAHPQIAESTDRDDTP